MRVRIPCSKYSKGLLKSRERKKRDAEQREKPHSGLPCPRGPAPSPPRGSATLLKTPNLHILLTASPGHASPVGGKEA